jgi:MFS family permease
VSGAGAFMAMLDATVANLALEAIRADLAATLALVQWVATEYLIALAVSLPATAWLGSRYGYLCALAPGAPDADRRAVSAGDWPAD